MIEIEHGPPVRLGKRYYVFCWYHREWHQV